MASILKSNQLDTACISYCGGIRCCALGSVVCGGYLVYKGGNYALIASASAFCRNWYDSKTIIDGFSDGPWFFPDSNDTRILSYNTQYWNSTTNRSYWAESVIPNGTGSTSYQFCEGCGSAINTCSKTAWCFFPIGIKKVYY